MFEKDTKLNGTKYVSCIKLNGVPILPPLITHSKRKEIQKCKQQAIKLEKRLQREHELRQYIDKYYKPNLVKCTNSLGTANTLEHKLAFEDDLTSQINNLETFISNDVPLVIQKKTSRLSCDVQVSQYANNEFTVLTSSEKCKSDIVIIAEPAVPCTASSLSSNNENEVDIAAVEDTQKPRLIRSNSYILESPSPLLLEHLRRQNESFDAIYSHMKKDSNRCECTKNKGNIFLSDSSEVNTKEVEDSCRDVHDYHADESNHTDYSRTESELKNISISLSDPISNNGDVTIIESQYHLKEFIDNNVPQMLDNKIFLDKSVNATDVELNTIREYDSILKSPCDILANTDFHEQQTNSLGDENLRKILSNIPEVYSKQIVDLLEKQKQEQLLRIQKYIELQHMSSKDPVIAMMNQTHVTQNVETTPDLDHNPKLIVSSTSFQTVCDTLNFFADTSKSEELIENSSKGSEENSAPINCSRELFPVCNGNGKKQSKEDVAASKIGAACKGYLTRRLMRTDRVQGLIQTIRDALICAMQLHTESTDNINESDVELHRRLIQQVSAACFEFHDVFFALSVWEQMAVIRLDRERQKEKLKRPLSRVSSARSSRSSRSMTKEFSK